MSTEAQKTTEDARSSSHAVGISVGAVVAVIALYVLSVPFVSNYGMQLGLTEDALETFYAPLIWLYDNNETFEQCMDWYMKMFAPAYHAP